MIKASRGNWRRGAALAFPCIQPDMMMIAPRREKCSLPSITLGEFETEDVTIKSNCSLKVGYLEMHVADANLGMNWFCVWLFYHGALELYQKTAQHWIGAARIAISIRFFLPAFSIFGQLTVQPLLFLRSEQQFRRELLSADAAKNVAAAVNDGAALRAFVFHRAR